MSRLPMALLALLLAGVIPACACEDPDPMKDQYRDDPYGADPSFADGRAMRPLPPHVVPLEHSRAKDPLHTGVANGAYVDRVPLPLTRALLERGRHHFEIYCATCHGLLGDGNSFVAKNMKLRPPPSLLVHHEHEGPAARALRANEPLPMPSQRTAAAGAPASPSFPTGQAGLPAPNVVDERAVREAIARDAAEAPRESPPSAMPQETGTPPHFQPGFVFSVISEGYGLMPSYAPELTVEDRWAVVAYLDALRLSQRARISELPPELAAKVRAEGSP